MLFLILFYWVSCLTCPAIDDLKPVTHLLTVDMTSKEGTKLLREGIRYLVSFFACHNVTLIYCIKMMAAMGYHFHDLYFASPIYLCDGYDHASL